MIQYLPPNRGANIFGPGFISDDASTASLRGNNLISVRGYLSWEKAFRAGFNPSISSDPGLLLRKSFKFGRDDSEDASRIPVQPLGIVLHGVDKKMFLGSHPHLACYVVNNYAPMDEYIRSLSRCSVIVTSSLHGAVFGHALGIAVGVISVSGMVTGGSFKYRDYYSSLGLDASPVSAYTIGNHMQHFVDFGLSYPQPSATVVDCIAEKCKADLTALFNQVSL
jgi:pyruvyltransferase